jgi:hypothetical protein
MRLKSVFGYAAIIAISIVVILMRECQHQRDTDGLLIDISNYKDTAYSYQLENGKLAFYNDALELENEKQIKALLSKDEDFKLLLEGFKNIDATGSITNVFNVKHDTVKLYDTIPCDFEPIKVERISNEYTFHGTIMRTNFVIDSLTVPNEIKFVVGEKKTGLFKKESTIEVVNSNPLIQTTGLTAYVIEEKNKWGKRILFFASGVLVGVVTYAVATN